MTTANVSNLADKPRRRTPSKTSDSDPLAPARVTYLADSFGRAKLAELVGVSRSQPTRWISGEERPGPGAASLLIDLEHVYARARLIWGEQTAQTWLVSQNAYLDGARPVDALRINGASSVLTALDAEAWGSGS